MGPPTLLSEISSNESPVVDPNRRSPSELVVSEKAATVNEDEDASNSENISDSSVTYSKRQLKRLKKFEDRQKMREKWKLQRKLRNKARKTKNKLERLNLEKIKITQMSNSTQKFTVVIDFSYDELMNSKDLIKCGSQVVRCYSANRRSPNPMQLHFCNFVGKIETVLSKNNGYRNWDIHFHENNYLDVFDKSSLVYLTSESKNVLDTLEEEKVYIIGGLVDHNAHKGVSYRKAVHEGITHAQLPIKKYIQMKSRSVLTINHVFEILLKIANGDSWAKALRCIVPTRFFETMTVVSFEQSTDPIQTTDVENQDGDTEMHSVEEKNLNALEESGKMLENLTSSE